MSRFDYCPKHGRVTHDLAGCAYCQVAALEQERGCTCEWTHPVDGNIDANWPAELDPHCAVHGEPNGFPESKVATLEQALQRIAEYEYRSDRRKRGMVDESELQNVKRIARRALTKPEGEK